MSSDDETRVTRLCRCGSLDEYADVEEHRKVFPTSAFVLTYRGARGSKTQAWS